MRIFRQWPVRRLPDERGITGIETGVLLGALAAVSSLLAAVVINAGVSASHQLDTTVSAAMRQVDGGLMESGPVIVRTDGTKATTVVIEVRTLTAEPVHLTDADAPALTLRYVTHESIVNTVPFDVALTRGNGDDMLDPGETAQITVDLSGVEAAPRDGEQFTLMLTPADGPPLTVERTMPRGRPLDHVAVLW